MQTCFWFETQAEEAARFYTSRFANAKLGKITHYGDAVSQLSGKVMTVEFEIDGQSFVALNVGSKSEFTPAISFMIHCDTQAEIDQYWNAILDAGGKELMCGWITDHFGVTWQIVPRMLQEIMSTGNSSQRDAVMKEFMTMKKYDIARLEAARDGAASVTS